jgi:ribosomal protein S18 acetylase RimI-like enzyme
VDERVEIVEETIWESFAAYRASGTATVLDTETIRLGITGVPYAGLNGVFRARRISASALEETLLLFRKRGVETLGRWVDIWSGGRLQETAVRLRAALGLDASAACQHLIGYLDDEAVATAAVYHGRRASEIQHVATLDQHRRRGIGTAITAAAIELARQHGNRYAVLTASPDGEGLYRRLGFVTVCSVRRFLQRRKP